jgi:hypothetical protein
MRGKLRSGPKIAEITANCGNHRNAYTGCKSLNRLVPEEGLEPSQCCHRRILSPLRLPIPPFRRARAPKLARKALITLARIVTFSTGLSPL